jgi:cell division protein FtsB
MAQDGRFRQLTVVLLCLGLAVYFSYHAFKGRHGLEARLALSAKAQVLHERLASLEIMLSHLKHDVTLLQDEHLDQDLLDEAARSVLGYSAEGDIVILTKQISSGTSLD